MCDCTDGGAARPKLYRCPADAVEQLVDAVGLPEVVGLLAEVAAAKSRHLMETWQDAGAARLWHRAYRRLDAAEAVVRRIMEGGGR
jgi:hypothetical protein